MKTIKTTKIAKNVTLREKTIPKGLLKKRLKNYKNFFTYLNVDNPSLIEANRAYLLNKLNFFLQ